MVLGDSSIDDYADPEAFLPWTFASVTDKDGEIRVVSLSHLDTQRGPVVYWCDDHENLQHALPLLDSMRPRSLGAYETYLQQGDNLTKFVAICSVLDDLPDPLLAVQAIEWVNRRDVFSGEGDREPALTLALHSVQEDLKRRRRQFAGLVRRYAGVGS